MTSALLLALILAASQDTSLRVGTAVAPRGQTARGAIEVPAGSDASLTIPVVVVNGASPGPVLAIVAGSHGTECASIIAVEELIRHLDPKTTHGAVILVPLVNIPSFEQKIAHVNPTDGKSMNRFYPGKMDGTQTDRASFLITREVIEKCDHLIVQKGMTIGHITDYLGKTILVAKAPESGVVLFIRAVPSMTKGETIANIGIPLR